MEGIVVESGKKFLLRYLRLIRAESGRYCNVRLRHETDKCKGPLWARSGHR